MNKKVKRLTNPYVTLQLSIEVFSRHHVCVYTHTRIYTCVYTHKHIYTYIKILGYCIHKVISGFQPHAKKVVCIALLKQGTTYFSQNPIFLQHVLQASFTRDSVFSVCCIDYRSRRYFPSY